MTKKTINWNGIIFIIVGIVVYFLRPFQSCDINLNPLTWIGYLFCSVFGLVLGPIFIVISAILILIGVIKLIKG